MLCFPFQIYRKFENSLGSLKAQLNTFLTEQKIFFTERFNFSIGQLNTSVIVFLPFHVWRGSVSIYKITLAESVREFVKNQPHPHTLRGKVTIFVPKLTFWTIKDGFSVFKFLYP